MNRAIALAVLAAGMSASAASANAQLIGGFEINTNGWPNNGSRETAATFDGISVTAASQGSWFLYLPSDLLAGDTTYNPNGTTRPFIAIGDVITFDYVLPVGGVLLLQNQSNFATLGTFNTTSSGTIGATGWSQGSWTATVALTQGSGLVFQGPVFNGWALDNVRIVPVPAPGTAALLGLGGLMASRRRRATNA